MRKWFSRLSIQSLLFAICGSITLIAALSVGIDTFNTVRMQTDTSLLFRLFNKLEETYAVQTILQSAKSLDRQFLYSPDPFLAAQMESYRVQFDTFLREASLRAETAEEKAALYELGRIAQAYNDTYVALARAVSAQDPVETSRLVVQSVEYTDAMEEQIGILMRQSLTAFTETDETMLVRDITTMVVAFLALILYVLLAIAAARIINHRVNQPVLALTEAAQTVAQSRSLEMQPPNGFDLAHLQDLARRTDEMGQLAQAFVLMTEAIQLREQDLQRQADEIRAKIEQAS